MRLQNRTAVVYGAGQSPGIGVGIGRATALTLAREGARVLLVDRDQASAEQTRRMIEDEGGAAASHQADISSEADCVRVAAAAREYLGSVDTLVVGIGIHGPGSAAELAEDLWDRVLDVNLKGMWLAAKHILPIMMEQRRGSIVLISSIGSLRGGRSMAYSVSKAGVNRLTLSLATTYGQYDIRANAILPGLVETPMAIDQGAGASERDRDEYLAHRAAQVPISYRGTGWDVAKAALYLASDDAKYVSGVLLPVDGGLLAAR